ncbi:hypothetical protein BRADI_1g02480v3 [Brachypodium distachyon]|uniref:CCHC-type domain-containing protein n=1 Tax=Brachypodium distachyon TaxID=15368 RepID=I1GL48_BRADI|nr:hypothetical protein BRADI_1g02480v3 [Brachypodium distachyon]
MPPVCQILQTNGYQALDLYKFFRQTVLNSVQWWQNRPDFEQIRGQLLSRTKLPNMAVALSSLLAEETRLRSLASSSVALPHVLASSVVPQLGVAAAPSFSEIICSHCKRPGHRVQRCFKLRPELLAELRARRGASQGGAPRRATNVPSASAASVMTVQPEMSHQLSDGSAASTPALGSSNPSTRWYWPSP